MPRGKMLDPNDTIPPAPSTPRPVPRAPRDEAAALVDKHMPKLARACHGWLRRGERLEALVGEVRDCLCRPRVLRLRDEADLEGLVQSDGGSRPDRLAVVVTVNLSSFVFHATVPEDIHVPDTRGLLAPMHAERQARLDRSLERYGAEVGELVRRHIRDRRAIDDLVVVSRALSHGWFYLRLARDVDPRLLEAARFCTKLQDVLLLLEPETPEEGWAATGLSPESIGLDWQDLREGSCVCLRWTTASP
jgi:hypothetical protein